MAKKATKRVLAAMLLALAVGSGAHAQLIIIGEPPEWIGHGPPPPGWQPRDTPETRYVQAVDGVRVVVPRNADGMCAQVAMMDFKPRVTPDSLDNLEGLEGDVEMSMPNDGTCDFVIERATIKRSPFPGNARRVRPPNPRPEREPMGGSAPSIPTPPE